MGEFADTAAAQAEWTEQDWLPRAEAHQRRVDDLTAGHRARAAAGRPHPVWDFLFTYYSLRPGRLRTWNPGWGTVLTGPQARSYLARTGYARAGDGDGVSVSRDYLRSRAATATFVARLLRATTARSAQLGCFGMHEWAMVYRSGARRHGSVPLRLGPAGTDAVVESLPLRCTHVDAYRFFTPQAAPLNRLRPTRDTQTETEQPGCLHATMDLYKWAYKLGPLVESEFVVDCLELAAAARETDMRASPYDLSEFGFEPIKVEEPAGRADYVRRQTELAERAAPLRAGLLRRCELLTAAAGPIGCGDRSGRSRQAEQTRGTEETHE